MPPPQQSQSQITDFLFPINGISIATSRAQQLPDTTVIGINVRAFESLTLRARGGSRPGVSKYVPQQLPLNYTSGSRAIQNLTLVNDPTGQAVTPSFIDLPTTDFPWILDINLILIDGSYNTYPPGGSGNETNKDYKRKYPQIVIKAKDQKKVEGTEFTFTGNEFILAHGKLQPGDTIFTVAFQCAGADAGAAAGTYPIVPSKAVIHQGFTNNKPYQIAYQNGTMTVTAIAFVQAASQGFDSGSSPYSLSYGSNVTKNNLLVLFWASTFGHITSITDTIGNTWTLAGRNGAIEGMECWYCVNKTTGANMVTVASGGNALSIAILEYSGLNATSPLDNVQVTNVPLTAPDYNTLFTHSISTASPDANVFIGAFAQSSEVETFAPGGGATLRTNVNDGNDFAAIYVEDLLSVPGSMAMTGVLSGVGNPNIQAAIGVSFKP